MAVILLVAEVDVGKLSINVPAELERELRSRADTEGTTISALITDVVQREFRRVERLAALDAHIAQIEADQQITAEQRAAMESDIDSFLRDADTRLSDAPEHKEAA